MNLIEVIKSGDFLILDTETTGLGSDAEICQIAIIDAQGNVLLDTLVKPVNPIPPDATAIHGITNEMVKDAFQFPADKVLTLIERKNVIVYNADYDSEMLYRAENAIGWGAGVRRIDWRDMATFHCAMKHFAELYGDYNPRYKSYKWKSLDTACAYYDIKNNDAHSALSDCRATLAVVKAMAAGEGTK